MTLFTVQPAGNPLTLKLDVPVAPKVTLVREAVTVPLIPVMVTVAAAVAEGGPVVVPVTAFAAKVRITVPGEQPVRPIE